MKKSSLPLVDSLLLLMVLIWAVNFTVIKLALVEIPPLAFNALRFIGSSIFFATYYHFFVRDYKFIKKYFWQLLVLGFLGNTLMQVLFIEGIYFTTASNTSLMYATIPMIVALLSAALRYEKVVALSWVGVALSFIGIILVLSESGSGLDFSKGNLRGDILILLCASMWSIFTVFSRPLMMESSMIKVVSVTFVFGTVFLIPTGIPDFLSMNWAAVSWKSWALLCYSFFFANIIAYVIWFYALTKIGNVQTAIFQNLVPIFAIITAVVYLHETVTLLQVLGGLGIIAGVTITRLSMVSIPKEKIEISDESAE